MDGAKPLSESMLVSLSHNELNVSYVMYIWIDNVLEWLHMVEINTCWWPSMNSRWHQLLRKTHWTEWAPFVDWYLLLLWCYLLQFNQAQSPAHANTGEMEEKGAVHLPRKAREPRTQIVYLPDNTTRKHRIPEIYHIHDDVIKWKHLPRYWPFARINGWVNTGEAGDLRRHSANYDGIVMICYEKHVIHLPKVMRIEWMYHVDFGV